MQRRFVDLQFKRSELEKQLKTVNEVLFSLGREMEQNFPYEEFYKQSRTLNALINTIVLFLCLQDLNTTFLYEIVLE